MSIALVNSRAAQAMAAPVVRVEVHLSNGLPALSIVGLPETAVKESKDRVRSAVLNAQFDFPLRRITVNLAPADLPKEGGRFDLPIALGILAASGQIPADSLRDYELVGELALTGELRPIRGALPVALACREAGRTLILPTDNAEAAALVRNLRILPARHLLEVCAHLNGSQSLREQVRRAPPAPAATNSDLAEVVGQHHARRALEVAAAGAHNLLMMGPPGTGKTMLASRLPGILPSMTETEALEAAALASISGHGDPTIHWARRPFRAPHHTASGVALVGGGSHPRPGEISLAHHGVLFLDELPEFDRRVLEALREPLETGSVSISRAALQAEFPARVQLVAAMNPCPCGYLGDASGRCHCTVEQVRRYRARISGPLLDRIDLHIELPCVARELIPGRNNRQGETSAAVRARVCRARARQEERCGMPNSRLDSAGVRRYCRLGEAEIDVLRSAVDALGLSARSVDRVLKVARTIADLDAADRISAAHLGEALSFRRLDRLDSPYRAALPRSPGCRGGS